MFQGSGDLAFLVSAGCRLILALGRVASHFRYQRKLEYSVLLASDPKEVGPAPTRESAWVTIVSWTFYVAFLFGAFRLTN